MRKNILRSLWFQATAAALLIIVIASVVAIVEGAIKTNKKPPQKQAFIGTQEEKAIHTAESYFLSTLPQVQPSQRVFLDYLQRKFGLDKTLSAATSPIDLYENPQTYPEEIHFLARIAYPDKIIKLTPKGTLERTAITNIYSANCDHLPLPANFGKAVQEGVRLGSYDLTHVALALAFLKDNKCVLPQEVSSAKTAVTNGLVKIAGDPSATADLRYEAVAFLMLEERHDLVQHEWMDQIMKQQREDGGWGELVTSDRSNDHSSLLALWALLEYYRPKTPDQPLIRH